MQQLSTKRSKLPLTVILAFLLLLSLPVWSLTDTELFQQGLSSFRKNRVPEAVNTFNRLLHSFPKTSHRDMALYYLARSYQKGGKKEKAGEVAAMLMKEFPANYNEGTLDPDLLKLVRQRSASGIPVSPPESPAPGKLSSPAAGEGAKKSESATRPATATPPSFQYTVSQKDHKILAGTRISIPYSLANRGSAGDRYRVRADFPPPFAVRIQGQSGSGKAEFLTPPVPPGGQYHGSISVAMPVNAVDGSRYAFPLVITSEMDARVSQSRKISIGGMAPLVQAIVTPREKATSEGAVAYTVTVLNVGSATAEDIGIRLECRSSLEAVEAGSDFRSGGKGLTAKVTRLQPGEARELRGMFIPESPPSQENPPCRVEVSGYRTVPTR